MSRIKNTQVDEAPDIDEVMLMYNLEEQSDNSGKKSGILWQYCKDEVVLNLADNSTVDFNGSNATTSSFIIQQKVISKTRNNGSKDVEIMVPLKYLGHL